MKMKKFALINIVSFLTLLNIGGGYPELCPEEIKLKICSCSSEPDGLSVLCSNSRTVTDANSLTNDLCNLRSYEVKKLILSSINVNATLPRNLFYGTNITRIHIHITNLTFSGPAFDGLDSSLQELIILESTMKSSEKFAIEKLSKLRELNMERNAMGTVRNNWLNGKIPNIKIIWLNENEITKIESRAFSDLSLLDSISLSQNRIKDLQRRMFPQPASKLQYMYLNDNELLYLPEDFFTDMPVLKDVYLSKNSLTTLPEITWKTTWQKLEALNLYENNLICDSSLNWLKEVKWPKILKAECVAPSAQIGKSLKDVYGTG